MASTVTKSDILKACEELGLKKTDTIIIHSSMKSFGYVEGGTTTVIEGFREYLSEGTLCFPALRQKDFGKAYKDWDINNTPSDVGFLSESFRKYPGVLRSDQETHSVTAIGKDAEFITSGHRGGKPRICLYGDYAFSYTSPWQRICDLGGKVLFIGVQMKYNTMKHLVESTVVTDIIEDGGFRGIRLINTETGDEEDLYIDGMFVAIGQKPENEPFENIVKLNEYGYVQAGEDCIPEGAPAGIFVAGDCRSKTIRQVTTATGDGAVAALAACRFLDTLY
jgi:aminoglycoside N3'-acetyltransferase